jgi:hypothetical protein
MCSQGIHLTDRPVRLLPSFVPHSFLGSQIEWQHRDINNEDRKWFKLYRVNPDLYSIEIGRTISELTNTSDGYIFYAICARLGIIS